MRATTVAVVTVAALTTTATETVRGPQHDDLVLEELTDRDRDILDFEAQWWRQRGSKEQAIRDRFAMPPTQYYQVLTALIETPAAAVHDPLLISRLRRQRAAQWSHRSARRIAG